MCTAIKSTIGTTVTKKRYSQIASIFAIGGWLSSGIPNFSYAQESPSDGGCQDGDMSCLWADIFAHGGCPLTYRKIMSSDAGEILWYVSSRRGGGWALVDTVFAFLEPLAVQGKVRRPTETLLAWSRDSGSDEVNGCELDSFSDCYWHTDFEREDFEVCKQWAAARYRDNRRSTSRDRDSPREVGTCIHPTHGYRVYRTPHGRGECNWVSESH